MRKLIALLVVAIAAGSLIGCSEKQEDTAAPTTTAPINNNAPEAKNAPAAPGPGPDVPTPGGKRMK